MKLFMILSVILASLMSVLLVDSCGPYGVSPIEPFNRSKRCVYAMFFFSIISLGRFGDWIKMLILCYIYQWYISESFGLKMGMFWLLV